MTEIVKYATFRARFIAHVIDVLICFVGFLVFSDLYELFMDAYFSEWQFVGFMFLFYSLYFIVLESFLFSATLGKHVMRIHVVTEEGHPLSLFRSFIRYCVETVSTVFFFIGYLMILFSDKHQCLHDKVAATIVVEVGPPPL